MIEVRLRRVLFLTVSATLVLIYVVWWATYASTHQGERFTQLPPGRPAESADATITLLSLVQAPELVDAKGGDPVSTDPGAVWVVAGVEITKHRAGDQFLCGFAAIGPERRIWEGSSPYVERAVNNCDEDEMVVGQPYPFEAIFMVPQRYADQLAGIAPIDHSTAKRASILVPR